MNTTLYDNIDWVGAVDWNIRDFHSYETNRGATYNAYLVRDEKTAPDRHGEGPLRRSAAAKRRGPVRSVAGRVTSSATTPSWITRAGCRKCCGRCRRPRCCATRNAPRRSAEHFDTSAWKIRVVANGEEISLGRRTLRFLETPMVHWPESMATYVPEEKLLFSMDAFGQHYASSERFEDEVDAAIVMQEAKTYYANIVMPYGKAVLKTLDAAGRPADRR